MRTVLNIAVVFVILCSCKEKPAKNPISDDSKTFYESADTLSDKNSLKIAKDYAETFYPDSTPYQGIGKLKNVPDSVVTAFHLLGIENKKAQENYLTLIFIKLYRDHLQCCHQSYELRNNSTNNIDKLSDPLLYEFNLLTKQFDNSKHIEFVNSGIAQSWIEKNPELLKYDKIAQEINMIKKVEDSISKGLYW